jgi:hypothetical protein
MTRLSEVQAPSEIAASVVGRGKPSFVQEWRRAVVVKRENWAAALILPQKA